MPEGRRVEPRGEEEEAEDRRELSRQEERGEVEEESSPVSTSQQNHGISRYSRRRKREWS